MTPKLPTNDSGTATAGIAVAARWRRKTKITATTSTTARISSNCTSSTDARIVVVRSVRTLRFTADGMLLRQLRQEVVDAVDDLDDVGARLALDVHDHRRRLVHPRRLAHVLGVVGHVGDVGEPHRRAVALGDDERPVVGAGQELIVGADHVRLARAVEAALRLVDVGGGDGSAHVRRA